ncbi:MAG: TRAP transporter substrate-binding protein [Pseudomonadota bacterium]
MRTSSLAYLFGAAALVGAFATAPLSAQQIVLKAGHSQNAEEPMHQGLEIIKRELEAATGGKATVQVFPNMQLGGEVEMIKQVLTGTLDITSPSNAPLTNFVPELKIFDMPFLFKDEPHMYRVLRGPMLQEIDKIVANKGIKLLGVFAVGTRHIMTKDPINSMADLKGKKIRVMQNPVHLEAFKAFGANATPVSYAELYGSLQTGVVDGAEAANTNYWEKKFYEVSPHWAMLGWTILTAPIIMSEKNYAKLPKDVQEVLVKAGHKAAVWEQDHYAALDVERLEMLKQKGIKITTPDPKPFREAAKQVFEKFLTTELDKRLLKMIQDTP